ncbi:MAG: ABC transporter substrate-binding protein [Azospirillum sp.]|nr:ABC transporter substrate-binding protein [Azospirillum sp.]
MRRWSLVVIVSWLSAASLGLTPLDAAPCRAEALTLPVLVPLTGFLAAEAMSQRNGAILAAGLAPPGLEVRTEVIDSGTSADSVAEALTQATGLGQVRGVVANVLGVQMQTLVPLATAYGIPIITVANGPAASAPGSDLVFRFWPGEAVTTRALARYAVEELGARRPALISQNSVEGESGRDRLRAVLGELAASPVFDEVVDAGARDLAAVIARAMARSPDVLMLQLNAGPSALFVRQATAAGVSVPILAGSALHRPSTTALLEPAELKGVCAESAASPVSDGSPGMTQFVAEYRARFGSEPDALALCQFDGVGMLLHAVADGATTSAALSDALASRSYRGLAMTYKSDGAGNMAHAATILCYDGESRIPKPVKQYDFLADGVR